MTELTLVQRLREYKYLCQAAADEIERLQHDVDLLLANLNAEVSLQNQQEKK